MRINPLNANPTKWPNILKQLVAKLPTNCLSVFGHFLNLTLKGLRVSYLILRVILELLRDISKGTKLNVYKKQHCTKNELKNSRESNKIRTYNHLVRKWTLNQHTISCYDIIWRKNNFASLNKNNLPITSRISMKNV